MWGTSARPNHGGTCDAVQGCNHYRTSAKISQGRPPRGVSANTRLREVGALVDRFWRDLHAMATAHPKEQTVIVSLAVSLLATRMGEAAAYFMRCAATAESKHLETLERQA